MTESSEEIMQLLNEKIKYGQDLIQNIQSLNHVDGAMKLQRKVRQEIEFLKKLLKSKKVKIEQLSCSNLRHLGALVECALRPGVTAVCKIFHISNENKLVIDIVSDDGKVWIKVIARNPRSLSALSAGNASYGARSILDQAEDYITCATLYPCMYKPPQVLSSVQFLANGGYQRQIGQDHSLCAAQTTTGKFIDQFVNSLNQRLLSQWIQFPGSEATRRVVSRGFQDKFGVPNVLGAIDCTHVKIFPPSGPQGAQYKNLRKGDHTINVQLIADSQCQILSVNARYPGRVHDSFIWHHCNVRSEMKRLWDGRIGNYFLLGDSGYPLEPWLMTPIVNATPETAEQRYTDWHCKARNVIERTNGYLKGSLRCIGIDRVLHYEPEKASALIYASCIIYNIMKHFRVDLEESDAPGEESNPLPSNHPPTPLLTISRRRRQEIINQYFQ